MHCNTRTRVTSCRWMLVSTFSRSRSICHTESVYVLRFDARFVSFINGASLQIEGCGDATVLKRSADTKQPLFVAPKACRCRIADLCFDAANAAGDLLTIASRTHVDLVRMRVILCRGLLKAPNAGTYLRQGNSCAGSDCFIAGISAAERMRLHSIRISGSRKRERASVASS